MRHHLGEFTVAGMCRVLDVNRSGFYAWLKAKQGARAASDAKLKETIEKVFEGSRCRYGSPRVWKELRNQGHRIGRKRVERLMRKNRLRAKRQYRKPRYVAGRAAVVAPNRLGQEFSSPRPDRVWVTDITYIHTLAGWLFLAAVLDLCTRRVVGWSMSGTQDRGLVLDALTMAVAKRRPKRGLTLHSDQGVQFGAEDVQRFLSKHDMIQSMSRRGNCYDNAVMESFFSTLKKELIQGKVYANHEDAKLEIVDYIEGFYNRERIHSALGGVSPVAFEALNFGT